MRLAQNGCLLGKSTRGFLKHQMQLSNRLCQTRCRCLPFAVCSVITSRREEARWKPLAQLSTYVSVHRCHQVWRSSGSHLTLLPPWNKFLQHRQNLLNCASPLPEFISSWDVVSLNKRSPGKWVDRNQGQLLGNMSRQHTDLHIFCTWQGIELC